MKKFKRILSVILSAIIVLSAVPAVFAQNATAEITLTSEDYSAANKLKAIGIIDEVSKETMERIITRRESAELMVKMLNIPVEGAEYDKSPFIDVHPASDGMAEIVTLYNMGFVSRGEDLKFNPDNSVTFNEAVAFVVKAMGYRVIAESKGGYPSGYLNIASKYDLLENIQPKAEEVRFYEMYHMIAKALEAPAYTYAGSVGDEDYYSQEKDLTILNEYHKMRHIEGIVTADSFSQLYSEEKPVADKQIAIDGTIYELGNDAKDDFLGKTVVAIVKIVDDSEDMILYIEEDSKNISYKLEYDELLPEKTTNQKLAYSENDKVKYYDLDANCRVIYNGLNWGGYHNIKETLPVYGSVELLDNNKDGKIDVLRVMDYRNIIVSYVDEYDGVIYDKSNSALDLSYDDENKLRIYDAETMQKISVNELLYNDVLSVAVSKNGKNVTGYVSRKYEIGKIEEVINGTTDLYKIGGNSYETVPNASFSLSVGTNGIFRIDYLGKIAEYEIDAENQGGFTIAVLTGVQNNGSFLGVDLKMFNQDGTFSILNAKEKIVLDGVRKNSTENATVGLMTAHVGEIVRYKTSEGKVSEIDFAYVTNYALGENGTESLGSLTELASGTYIKQRSGIFDVGGRNFCMSLDTNVLFLVPDDLSYDEGYQIVTASSQLSNGHRYTRGTGADSTYTHPLENLSVKAYNMGRDDSTVNKAVAVMMRSAAYDESTASQAPGKGGSMLLNVVTDITDAYDFYNEKNCKRIYFNDGSYRNVADLVDVQLERASSSTLVDATLADAHLEPGDIISFSPTKGTITSIKVWHRKDEASPYGAILSSSMACVHGPSHEVNTSAYDSEQMYTAGYVNGVDKTAKVISYTTLDGANNWMSKYSSPTVILVRDDITEKNKVEFIDVAGIRVGDRIVFYSHLVIPSLIVVYRD